MFAGVLFHGQPLEDKARDYVLKQLFPKWSYPIANHAPALNPGAAAGGGSALCQIPRANTVKEICYPVFRNRERHFTNL